MDKSHVAIAAAVVVAGCASLAGPDLGGRALEVMRASFKDRGQAKVERLEQDEVQAACSRAPD